MEFKIKGLNKGLLICYLSGILLVAACTKPEIEQIKVKAPLRNYVVTARLDNKQAETESHATGLLKGTYSEKTKLFTYTLKYENLTPVAISINKGTRGATGTVVIKIMNAENAVTSPFSGEKYLSSLEERDLIKGLWFVTIGSARYSVCEIRGQVTIKQIK
jgi:hypothetical protein